VSRISCLSVASRPAPVKTTAARRRSSSGEVSHPRMSRVWFRRSSRTVWSATRTASTESYALARNRCAVSVPGSPQAGDRPRSSTSSRLPVGASSRRTRRAVGMADDRLTPAGSRPRVIAMATSRSRRPLASRHAFATTAIVSPAGWHMAALRAGAAASRDGAA
jgi:hypothetical protein